MYQAPAWVSHEYRCIECHSVVTITSHPDGRVVYRASHKPTCAVRLAGEAAMNNWKKS